MELVSLCVRHLRHDNPRENIKISPYQLDYESSTLRTFVNTQEADIFVPVAKFLKRFIVDAKRNRSIQAIVKAHIHYAYFDAD